MACPPAEFNENLTGSKVISRGHARELPDIPSFPFKESRLKGKENEEIRSKNCKEREKRRTLPCVCISHSGYTVTRRD
jgi:hypothetical protein